MGTGSKSALSKRFMRVLVAGVVGVLSPELIKIFGGPELTELVGTSTQVAVTALLVAADKAIRAQLAK